MYVAHSFLDIVNSSVDVAHSFSDIVNFLVDVAYSSLDVFHFDILQVSLSNWDRVWIPSPSPVDPESRRVNVRRVLVVLKGAELWWASGPINSVHTCIQPSACTVDRQTSINTPSSTLLIIYSLSICTVHTYNICTVM